MTKGMPRVLARQPAQAQAVRRQRVELADLAIRTTGATGVGYGSAVIGDLPQGNILFLGATAYMRVTALDAGGAIGQL